MKFVVSQIVCKKRRWQPYMSNILADEDSNRRESLCRSKFPEIIARRHLGHLRLAQLFGILAKIDVLQLRIDEMERRLPHLRQAGRNAK